MDPLTIAALGAQLLGKQQQAEQANQPQPVQPVRGVLERRKQSLEDNPLNTLQGGLSALQSIQGLSGEDKAKAANLLTEAQQVMAPPIQQPAVLETKGQIAMNPRRQFYG